MRNHIYCCLNDGRNLSLGGMVHAQCVEEKRAAADRHPGGYSSTNLSGGHPELSQTSLEFVQSSKNIIDADSEDENEMHKAASVPTSSEIIMMKNMRRYLDAHSNGEMDNKMDDITRFLLTNSF
ncbi:hypothetical protein TNCV_3659241 [Trichonephila clavipes]|nr:hypothetical protein TNCV_3659241 [Trichonephila clavipes]